MTELATCVQCNRVFWRSRNTKTTCSDKCRKAKSRGNDAFPYWKIDNEIDRYTDFMELIIDQRPKLFIRLQQIRDRYGRNAMLAAIDTIHIALTGDPRNL